MKSLIQATFILLIVNCFLINKTTAQISINSDGATPDASAMLDVTSTDKGILIPRMDSTSRKNIANPAIGLMVYDSTTTSFWYYANSTWNNISAILSDADGDTKIQVEESNDEDIIRFDLGGTEFMRLDSGRIEILNTGKSIFIGKGAGENDDFSDNQNIFIGDSSGYNNTTGSNNFFQGYQSGYNNTAGLYNLFQGSQSGYSNTTGSINLFQGHQSGYSNTTGYYNTFQGISAGVFNTTGFYNTFLGVQTGGYNTTGNRNTFLGVQSGLHNKTGNKNTFLGVQSGNFNTDGDKNVFIGFQAGYNETGSNKLYIDNSNTTAPLIFGDFDSDSLQINGTLNINGVYEFPIVDGTANQVLATDGSGTLSWSTMNLDSLMDTDGDTKIQLEESSNDDIIRFDLGGTEFLRLDNGRIEVLNTGSSVFIGAGAGVNDDFSDNQNVFIGDLSGYSNTIGDKNTFQGYQSGYSNTIGNNNTFQGYQSGYSNTTGTFNLFQGTITGHSNTIGYSNTFLGSQSGVHNTIGDHNTFLGFGSGLFNTEGNNNTFLGSQSGYLNTTGNNNTFLGYQSGYNTTGDKNVLLGYKAGYNETGSNKLYIDNSNTSTPLIYGDFDSDSLQINGKLNINGVYEFPIVDGTANQVLATDGSGVLSWSAMTLNSLTDTDSDTKIQLEESNNDNIIRFDLGGTEYMRLDSGRIEIVNTGESVFIGEGAGVNDDYSYNQNVFIGYESGLYNTTGIRNIFQGYQSGFLNKTGSYNTFLGSQSGAFNKEGNYNTFLGRRSGFANEEGSYNVFLGVESGYKNTTGDKNVFLGYKAGYNETGSNKLYIDNSNTNSPLIFGDFDSDTLRINGALSIRDSITLYGEAKFNEPVYINKSLGGLDNFIFTLENLNNKNNAYNNGINILAGQTSGEYNSSKQGDFIRFTTPDGTKIGSIYQDAAGSVALVSTSDIRLKTNIQTSQYGLSDILNIQVRDYQYKSDAAQTPQTGFLAQQLHEVFPVAVRVGGEDAKTNPWTVDYSKLTPLLVKGMQEQQVVIDELKAENKQLKMEVSKIQQLEHLSRDLAEQNAEMKAMLQQIQAQLGNQ